MGLPETVDFGRNFAVMVRAHGPDPKGLKMRKHAFHLYNSGKTTLSASGMLLSDNLYDASVANRVLEGNGQVLSLVLTVASVVEPFLLRQHRDGTAQGRPQLIPGAQIDVMLEGRLRLEKDIERDINKQASFWLTAQLIKLVDVPASTNFLQSLLEGSSGPLDRGWEFGWSMGTNDGGPQAFKDALKIKGEQYNSSFTEADRHMVGRESDDSSLMRKLATRIAIFGVCLDSKDLPSIAVSHLNSRGDSLLAVGSPFGVLSPVHFFNSISVGSITNCQPPGSSNISLLMSDIRCLPGMEGGPVFSRHAHLIGILTRPLRQKSSGAEVQLVIPWEAIATACSDLLLKEPQIAEKGINFNKENLNAVGNSDIHESDGPFNFNSHCLPPLSLEKAMASICLITVDEGVWASGVLLNDQGLILTNAHLLEPWRFGKATVSGGIDDIKSESHLFEPETSTCRTCTEFDDFEESQGTSLKTLDFMVASMSRESKGYKLSFPNRGHRSLRVRLDHAKSWIWCDAKVVYVSKGPLDVALLQLKSTPSQLYPINLDYTFPHLGSKAYIVGHGLFGPRCALSPSVCSGVVAKIVKAKVSSTYQSTQGEYSYVPAMLETTAAVFPGGSGGAVMNSKGYMIGLVTSNARHGGGTVIPYLNFSIPCAVLTPVFEFSKDMQDLSLLQRLDQPNEFLSSIWALTPPLTSKPHPLSVLEDNNKQVKGSKFAKFIAETGKVSTIPSNTTFSSKL
ncbi:hypothetical protein K2173_000787 [Erythroxylum novogranatense]|uniref:Glyoxysomal processing protease, glyoxysomal n=1 Tax=Erythroxylum novogranatense TaxID=1862640 RepID=A0AAV8T4I2_9ROSI|nr:hypothetical protein K2173_000787 [Erythroxylum novogranatense]